MWRRHADHVNRKLLADWLPPDSATILKTDLFDEAMGSGQAALLRSRSTSLQGIDIAVSIAREAINSEPELNATVCDIRRLPFPDHYFNVVISLSTLDHFRDRSEIEQALREIHRVMEAGGLLILTLDNPVNPLVALRSRIPYKLLSRMGVVPYYCGTTISPFDLPDVLERSGFKTLKRTAVMHCPRVVLVALAALIERYGWRWLRHPFLKLASAFEVLQHTPLRLFSGHFTATLSRKR